MKNLFVTYRRDSEKNPVYNIGPVRDFNADHVFDCGQCFRWRRLEDGSYTGIASGRIANVAYGDGQVTITGLFGTTEKTDVRDFWIDYLDLNRDYGKIKRRLKKDDPVMTSAIKEGTGIRILNQDLWETIVSFIISQNNNIPRIKGCIEGLARLAGDPIVGDKDEAYLVPKGNGRMGESVHGLYTLEGLQPYTIPSPEKLASMTVEDLAPVKLGYRAKYLIETAKTVCEKGLPGNMEELNALTGVGPKVANCIGLFGLGLTDSFPIDVWVARVMSKYYGFKEDDFDGMRAYAEEHFGKFSGFAQQYLFYHIRQTQ